MALLDHIWNLIISISIEKFIGLLLMSGILSYMFFLSRKYKKEIWDGIKGNNGKLEAPEMIILISMLLYPVIILADVFLGLHASDGVFWSIDSIILFALTGRIAINKFGGEPASKSGDQKIE